MTDKTITTLDDRITALTDSIRDIINAHPNPRKKIEKVLRKALEVEYKIGFNACDCGR